MAAPSGVVTAMAIDDQAFESHSAPASDSLVNATIFNLSHERTFSDGDHLLKIKGNFDGRGERNYTLPITVKNGMVYLRN